MLARRARRTEKEKRKKTDQANVPLSEELPRLLEAVLAFCNGLVQLIHTIDLVSLWLKCTKTHSASIHLWHLIASLLRANNGQQAWTT
jgi:hypothetical protein